MLLDDRRSDFGDARRGRLRLPSARWRIALGVASVPVLLLVLQIVDMRSGFDGPLVSLWRDYAGTPKSVTLPWAALGLSLVGLSWRRRFQTVAIAVAMDVAIALLRLLLGGEMASGNGAVIALTGIAVVAGWRWRGVERRNALHAAALGALLLLATKVGDVWLHITVLGEPAVLDRYAVLADHALGQPSWLMGRFIEALGPVASAVVHWVYIELPVAAMVIAVWQLRHVVSTGVWPRHYLVRTFLVLGLIGPVVYLLFPVVGPMFVFAPNGNGLQLGNYWPQTVPPFDHQPAPLPFDRVTPRNCMPSMHTAWAMSVFLHSRRATDGSLAPRWLRWGGTVWLVCTLTATLGFGYHYGVDLLAGAVLCLTVESALRAPERGWDRARIGLVGAGVALLGGLLLSCRLLAGHMAAHPLPAGILLLGTCAIYAWAFRVVWFPRPPRQSTSSPGSSSALSSPSSLTTSNPSRWRCSR